MKDVLHRSTSAADVEQLTLLPVKSVKPSAAVDVDYLRTLTSSRRALRYAMSLRDLEPKQVYDPLGIDKSTWSKIETGVMSFPIDELQRFCEIVGNHALLYWHVNVAGYDVRSLQRLQDEKDRQIDELKAQLEEERREKRALITVVKSLKS